MERIQVVLSYQMGIHLLTHGLVELRKGVLADVMIAEQDTREISPAKMSPDIPEIVCVRTR